MESKRRRKGSHELIMSGEDFFATFARRHMVGEVVGVGDFILYERKEVESHSTLHLRLHWLTMGY